MPTAIGRFRAARGLGQGRPNRLTFPNADPLRRSFIPGPRKGWLIDGSVVLVKRTIRASLDFATTGTVRNRWLATSSAFTPERASLQDGRYDAVCGFCIGFRCPASNRVGSLRPEDGLVRWNSDWSTDSGAESGFRRCSALRLNPPYSRRGDDVRMMMLGIIPIRYSELGIPTFS